VRSAYWRQRPMTPDAMRDTNEPPIHGATPATTGVGVTPADGGFVLEVIARQTPSAGLLRLTRAPDGPSSAHQSTRQPVGGFTVIPSNVGLRLGRAPSPCGLSEPSPLRQANPCALRRCQRIGSQGRTANHRPSGVTYLGASA